MNLNTISRRVHMDFHTPDTPWDKMMQNFDAVKYVKTLKDANLNSLVAFSKCHHGYMYYNTTLGIKHPKLPKDLDMLGEIIKECHNQDMKVLIYYSVGWNTMIQKDVPDWMEYNANGQTVGTDGNPKTGPWANICLNSPYTEEMVLPELAEIIDCQNGDGLWLDIIECSPCRCRHCQEKYRKQFGTEMPEDNSLLKDWVVQTKYDFVKKCYDLCKSKKPDWMFTYNTAGRDEKLVEIVDFCSIETHPGAPEDRDAWAKSTLTYKLLQSRNKAWESCTSRFIHGWGGWDDQPLENMKIVCSRILAHGGLINLGDQAYPDGTLDAEIYKKMGAVFNYLEPREEIARSTKNAPYVALLTDDFDVYFGKNHHLFGAVEVLSQQHFAFDLINLKDVEKYSNYKCLILPEIKNITDENAKNIQQFVENGGKLLCVGQTAMENGDFKLAEILGCSFKAESEFSNGYLKLEEEICQNVRKSPLLIPCKFPLVTLKENAISLAEKINPVIEPVNEEFYMFRHGRFAPPADKTGSSGIIFNKFGKGSTAFITSDMFSLFNMDEQWYVSDIIGNVLNYMIDDKIVELKAPLSTEINITENDDNFVCHLIQFGIATEAFHVRESIPALNVELSVSLDLVKPVAKLMPDNKDLEVTTKDGKATVKIDILEGYKQVVFEKN